MRVNVTYFPPSSSDQSLDLDSGATALDLLSSLSIPPDATIVMREGKPIPLDAGLADGDELKLLTVMSGG